MGSSTLVLVATLCCLLAAQSFCMLFCNSSSDNEIAVYSRAAQNLRELTGNFSEHSLSHLHKVLGSCTTVYFCSPVFKLDESLSFVDLHDVSFVGGKKTTFNCNGVNGIRFTNITNLKVENITFINCAQSSKLSLGNKAFKFMSGLQTLNCTHMRFISTNISHSGGVGLSVINTGGNVLFRQCSFEFNGRNKVRGGAGLVIEMSTYHGTYWDINNALYSLTNCTFTGNYAYERDVKSTPFGRGGGLRLYVRDASANNRVVVNLCIFHNNTASRWGGALFASVHDVAANNSVVVKDSIFTKNQSPLGYGGAAYVGFQRGNGTEQCLNNSHLFDSCSFLQNLAQFGGGSVFISTRIYAPSGQYNKMKYLNCTWSENLALFGSAVALLPDAWSLKDVGSFPTPVFEDSAISTNHIIGNDRPLQTPYEQHSMGLGGIYCTLYIIIFRKNMLFEYNNGSAIVGSSCFLSFQEDSVVSFRHNTGYSGGAMHLLGYSTIYVHQNSSFTFSNNTADTNGGAIYYHSSDLLEHDYSSNCFITRDESATNSSISFFFSQNQAGLGNLDVGYGNSIYSTSLLPCLREYYALNSSNTNSYLSQIANFTFADDSKYDLTTEVGSFSTRHIKRPMRYVPIIPGKYTVLEFEGLDDLNHARNSVYLLTVKNDAYSSVKTYDENSYVTNNSIRLLGNPGDTATIELATITQRKTVLSFRVELQPCPPGYIYSNTCVCSSDTYSPYYGIESCDNFEFQARRSEGYWCGYDKNKTLSDPSAFITGSCPKGFCAFRPRVLPGTASREALSETVCNPSRKGLLCSHCKQNKTVFYHSPNFKCGSRDLCHLGGLFYFASDIVPATLLFVIILAWDISFTSGCMNGFILYAQVIGFFQLSAHDRIVHTELAGSVLSVFQILYDVFNLQFFNHDKLSFCLLANARALDLLLVQSVTLLYSFLLVLFIVIILKVCNVRCLKLLFKCRIHKIQTSMVHGLSAFLVLCFAQCAKLAISTLWAGFLLGKNGRTVKAVVYLHPGIDWLSTRHLKYAIPTLMVAFVLVIIPLLVLLVYPLCYKCLGLLKLSNTRAILICHKLLPFEKVKPFLDSFQGGYNDNCRVFSGIYFLYRILILLNMAVTSLKIFYLVLELQLVLMLLINAIAQPYKKVKHNVIDSLLFANMALINAISMYKFSISHYPHGISNRSYILSTVQVMLVGVPMLCIMLYCAYCFIKPLFAKCSRRAPRLSEVNRQNEDLLQYCDLASSRSDPAEESSITQSFATNSYNTFDY